MLKGLLESRTHATVPYCKVGIVDAWRLLHIGVGAQRVWTLAGIAYANGVSGAARTSAGLKPIQILGGALPFARMPTLFFSILRYCGCHNIMDTASFAGCRHPGTCI